MPPKKSSGKSDRYERAMSSRKAEVDKAEAQLVLTKLNNVRTILMATLSVMDEEMVARFNGGKMAEDGLKDLTTWVTRLSEHVMGAASEQIKMPTAD